MRVALALTLSPEERARLLRWRDAPSSNPTRATRARLILLAAAGRSDGDIATALGVHRRTVALWRRRFLSARVHGLRDARSPSRRGRIPEERLQTIVRTTIGGTAAGTRTWSSRTLARTYGVSHMTVRRLWDLYGVRPVAPGGHGAVTDPGGSTAPWDVIGLLLRPPVAALVVTLRPRIPSDDRPASFAGTHGASVLRAFRPLPDEVPRTPPASREGNEYLRFLGEVAPRLRDELPALVLVVAAKGAGATAFERWQVRHPGTDIATAPDFEAWRGRALELLRSAGRREIPRGQHHGPAETVRSLARFLADYRVDSGPFEWVASRSAILEGEAAYRLRYELAGTGHPGFQPTRDAPAGRGLGDDPSRAMARNVLRNCLGVRPRDRVTIETWSETVGYANAFVLESLRLGAVPLLWYRDEPTYWAATTEISPPTLAQVGAHRVAALNRTDVFVSFFGPSDRERLHALPKRTLLRLGEYEDATFRAAERAKVRSAHLAIGRVSESSARMYGVDAEAWRSELVAGSLVDPSLFARRSRRLMAALRKGHTLEIFHPNGTRLALRLRGYRPILSDGRVVSTDRLGGLVPVTIPGGVVAVAVDESFAEGVFRSNRASSVGLSDTVGEMDEGEWTFRHGRLASFRYRVGEELFTQSYGRAQAGRDRPASISIGLNEHLHRSPLLEDQGLGTVTMHVGRNAPLGGRTRVPWWAWSFLDGANVVVDGRFVVRDGKVVHA